MSYSISVTNPVNESTWEKPLSEEEFDNIWKLCHSRGTVYVIPATVVPVRTGNGKNFCKDFFFPTLFNQALTIKNLAVKIIASLAALILDIATFPLRLLTAAPWVLINRKSAKNESHPLWRYLVAEGVNSKITQSEHVRVKFTWEIEPKSPSGTESKEREEVQQLMQWKEWNVNFIRQSVHDDFDYLDEGWCKPPVDSSSV